MNKIVLAFAAAFAFSNVQAAPTYMPTGVQTNVSVSTVLNGG